MKIALRSYFKKQPRLAVVVSLVTLIIGLIATYSLQHDAYVAARHIQQNKFAFEVEEIKSHIVQRMAAYEQVLRGVAGLYLASKSVERQEFHEYVSSLSIEKFYPGIQGIGFAQRIYPQEKTKFIAEIRTQGFADFSIRPEGERDVYSAIIYLEPFSGRNLRAFGFDMYSEPTRRTAMDRACDLNLAALSDKVKLIQEDERRPQAGLLMYLPIYQNGKPHQTVTERRANLVGWVYAPFRMNDFMEHILDEQGGKLDLELFDGENIVPEKLLYDADRNLSLHQSSSALFQLSSHIKILDKTWTVNVRSLPEFEKEIDTIKTEEIQFIGGVMSLMSALLVGGLVMWRAKSHILAEEKSIAATAFESQQGMIVTDQQTVILKVNRAFTNITGYTAEEAIGKTPKLLSSGRHGKDFYAAMWKSIERKGGWEGEIWNRRKNGEIYPEYLTITAVKNEHYQITNYVAALSDITVSKAASDEIHHLAYYDPLTRLPNRRLLVDRLQMALASSTRSGKEGALLFIDMDHFKNLNDTLGHDYGDMLLQQVAQRVEACVREGDTVARLGGDEFVVMLEDLSENQLEAAAQTELVGQKILAALNQPYQLEQHEYLSTPSIGATLFNDHQEALEELMKHADIAMYQAKKAGRNVLRFFDPVMQESVNTRAELEKELRKALEKKQFHLFFQVQVNEKLQPTGAETLIRWIHPERDMISPAQFIPLAEDTGHIVAIGRWVLEVACAQIKDWQKNTVTRNLVLAVNVSARQFYQPDFVSTVQTLLRSYAIPPALLKLELTESMLLDKIDDTIATMRALKELGVSFSLDDFGTGYSSLQYLKRLPISQLKIDQSFVRDISTDNSDKAIVRTIIAMAHSLNLDVIAEGVETEDQRQFLLHSGCTHYQGYLFGKPVRIQEFEQLLHKLT